MKKAAKTERFNGLISMDFDVQYGLIAVCEFQGIDFLRNEKLESLTVSFLECSGLSLLTLFERGEQERRPTELGEPFFFVGRTPMIRAMSIDLLAENGGDHIPKYGHSDTPGKHMPQNSEKVKLTESLTYNGSGSGGS